MYIFQYILNIFKPGSLTRIHTDSFLFTNLLGHIFSVICQAHCFVALPIQGADVRVLDRANEVTPKIPPISNLNNETLQLLLENVSELLIICWWFRNPSCQLSWTVVEISLFFPGFLFHPRWCRISGKQDVLLSFILVKGLVLADQNV